MRRRDEHMDEVPPLIPDEFYILMLGASAVWQLLALILLFFVMWA